MNCQDISELLDERDVSRLTAGERAGVELHLQSCRDCAADWDAHTRMLAVTVPALPAGLVADCRALAAAPGRRAAPRRAGLRSVVIGSLLLVGAAAAAVVGVNWSRDRQEIVGAVPASDVVVDSQTPPAAASGVSLETSGTVEPVGASAAAASVSFALAGSPAAGQTRAAAANGFTVAVSPLVHQSTNGDVMAATEAIYASLLDKLRAVPNLTLIELDSPVEDVGEQPVLFAAGGMPAAATATGAGIASVATAGPTTAVFQGAAASTGVPGAAPQALSFTLSTDGAGTTGLFSGSVTDGEHDQVFAIEGAGLELEEAAGGVVVNADRITLRPATGVPAGIPTGAADAPPGLINVILQSSFGGPEVAADAPDDGQAGGVGEAAEPAYDYVLNVSSHERSAPGSNAGPLFSFLVRGSKAGTRGATIMETSGRVSDRVDTDEYARQAVDQLRRLLFAPDESLLDEIRAIVVDGNAARAARLKGLNDLLMIANRAGIDWRSGAIVDAAVDLASSATSPDERIQIWRLMQGSQDPNLVGPLVNALLYDTDAGVRLAAADALGPFASDPTAQAALEYAGSADPSAEVAMQARWLALSDAGRRDYVVGTLLDASLSDAERVEPLLYARRSPATAAAPGLADERAATALIEIIRRTDDPARRSMLINGLGALDGADAPGVTAFLLERLAGDTAEGVRIGAAMALGGRIAEPGVRAALERAQATDASLAVRDLTGRALRGEAVPGLRWSAAAVSTD